jgi:AbrB family looped-hinge helix DNA binding protein
MNARISNEGQVALPLAMRRELGICAGDEVEVAVQDGRIVLSPTSRRIYKAEIISDPITGLPLLSAGPDAPLLTSEDVADMLADFP